MRIAGAEFGTCFLWLLIAQLPHLSRSLQKVSLLLTESTAPQELAYTQVLHPDTISRSNLSFIDKAFKPVEADGILKA